MKLKNKKTGEIIDLSKGSIKETCFGSKIQLQATDRYNKPIWIYTSLAELNEEWEDVPEEPKEYWYLSGRGEVRCIEDDGVKFDKDHKEIGNYFETKEEAELAVRKLKAWKRLKDKGFRFDRVIDDVHCIRIEGGFHSDKPAWKLDVQPDLDLLFGGEE